MTRAMKKARLIPFLFCVIGLFSCREHSREAQPVLSVDDFAEWDVRSCRLYSARIRNEINRLAAKEGEQMYADAFVRRYYAERKPFVWIDRNGVDERADSLLNRLRKVPELGLHTSSFHVDDIAADLHRLRTPERWDDEDINCLMARTEFHLTQAYLRYACGQRYGFVNPLSCFNRLERTDTAHNAPFRRLFDIPIETATDSFVHVALQRVHEGRINEFLAEIHPSTLLYNKLLHAYRTHRDDKPYADKLLTNLERSRWRTPQPSGKYIWVNLAGFILTAVDETTDSVLTMRVCGGDLRHKTPLLYSRVGWVELNPYWVVPTNIIRREIAPRHAGDTAYFARNRIRIIDKETREEKEPAEVTAAMLRSGRYMLRQDKGEDNSLGRLIFRFPNAHAVFLHDTNNRAAFERRSRAVSHGCIRLERPLDLAVFCLERPTPEQVDRIRISIDLPALTDAGRKWQEDPDYKKMSYCQVSPEIPVFLQYYTVYPRPDGELETFPDTYGYDEVLQKKLTAF